MKILAVPDEMRIAGGLERALTGDSDIDCRRLSDLKSECREIGRTMFPTLSSSHCDQLTQRTHAVRCLL